jgi:23S rRNA (uridine2552-2'-O)-methyltransferase
LLRFGALDLPARSQPLVAQHSQLLDFRALATAFAELQHLDVAWARHAVLVHDAFLGGLRAPEHQKFADVLDRRCAQIGGQLVVHLLARRTVIVEHADLDEAVGIQGGINFLLHRRGQAVAANEDHGIQVVGFSTVFAALGRSQLNLGHGPYYRASQKEAMKVKTQSKKVNKAWLNDHVNDTYVKLAHKEGYRARAAYKLKEIDEQLGLIKPGHTVVDLGSTPGAWSQYLRRRMSPTGAAAGQLNGVIIALDILPMEPIEGVTYLNGDFREPEVLAQLEDVLNGRIVDVVVSDMAPNLSGIDSADAARIAHLVELAVDFACNHLKPDGSLVVKLFHGSGYSELVALFKQTFKVVKPLKPKASRDKSSETFLVGMGLKNPPVRV